LAHGVALVGSATGILHGMGSWLTGLRITIGADLGPDRKNVKIQDRRFLRRLQRIDQLPKRKRQGLLMTIDAHLSGESKSFFLRTQT
jgi:hypothetical protein